MKKRLKKYLGIAMLLVIVMISNNSVYAMGAQTLTTSEVIEETIMKQALNLDSSNANEDKKFNVVKLYDSKDDMSRGTESPKTAIQAVTVNGESVEATTIIPYKVLSTGELINSFEYASNTSQLRWTPLPDTPIASNFVDLSVTVTAHFYCSYSNGVQVFRHESVEAYWNTSNSTVSVSQLEVAYMTYGDLYKYPECFQDYNAAFLQSNYIRVSKIDVVSPVKNRVYADYANAMPSNRVVVLTNYDYHEGTIGVDVVYRINGQLKTATEAYPVYRK